MCCCPERDASIVENIAVLKLRVGSAPNSSARWHDRLSSPPLRPDELRYQISPALPDETWCYSFCIMRLLRTAFGLLLWLCLPLAFSQTIPLENQAASASDPTFRIKPVHPVQELEREARAAKPPHESGSFRKPELVELVKLDPTIKLDIRYATSNNFLSTPMYSQARAFLQRPAAEALLRAQRALREKGYGLEIHDAYRPWYVTKMFWDATPEDKKIFVADPREGSKHNRGCAVDLTLYDLKTGAAVKMPSGYDEMSERAYADLSRRDR
jgi:D-alanyl-D-alanine dipeptidase